MTDAILTRREGSVLVARINNSARRNAIARTIAVFRRACDAFLHALITLSRRLSGAICRRARGSRRASCGRDSQPGRVHHASPAQRTGD